MEDGELNGVVVEYAPPVDHVARGAADRLLGRGGSHLTRLTVPSLVVEADEPRQFSLDGELVEHRRLAVHVRHRAMSFKVADGYEPHPRA